MIAFSGGVDSSLAALLALRCFGPDHVVACIGVSPSLSALALERARGIARHLGLTLWEVRLAAPSLPPASLHLPRPRPPPHYPPQVPTEEGLVPGYISNQGEACLHCKQTLYTTLAAVSRRALQQGGGDIVLFNGA